MADTKLDEKARRVRSLLSSYYGTGPGDGMGASGMGRGDSAEGEGRVASIDSAAFDAHHFLSALVRGLKANQKENVFQIERQIFHYPMSKKLFGFNLADRIPKFGTSI